MWVHIGIYTDDCTCAFLYCICQVTFLSENFWRRCCIAHCHCLNFTYSISRVTVPLDKPIWPWLENTREAQLHHVLSKCSYIESSSASWVILTLCPEPLRHYISPFRFNWNTPQQGWTLHPPSQPQRKKTWQWKVTFPTDQNGWNMLKWLRTPSFVTWNMLLSSFYIPEWYWNSNMTPEKHTQN